MDIYTCRAKSLRTGKWIYGYPARLDYMTNELFLVGPEFVSQRINQDTICRYIGHKDADGTPIFEHDILHGVFYHMFEDLGTFEVRWNDHDGGFEINTFEPTKCKILGNIFDNTELMIS